MKEATGELNMTVITVVAIAAVAALFYAFVWPMIKQRIVQGTCDAMGANYVATKEANGNENCVSTATDEAGGEQWFCCPSSN